MGASRATGLPRCEFPHVQGTVLAIGNVFMEVKPAVAVVPDCEDQIVKMPIFPSGPPHAVGFATPSAPQAAEPTWTFAAASCAAEW